MRGRHLAGQVVIPMINSRAAKAWKPEDRSLDRPTDRKGNDIKLDIIHNVQLSFCNTQVRHKSRLFSGEQACTCFSFSSLPCRST